LGIGIAPYHRFFGGRAFTIAGTGPSGSARCGGSSTVGGVARLIDTEILSCWVVLGCRRKTPHQALFAADPRAFG
jgi:hypothetical protein